MQIISNRQPLGYQLWRSGCQLHASCDSLLRQATGFGWLLAACLASRSYATAQPNSHSPYQMVHADCIWLTASSRLVLLCRAANNRSTSPKMHVSTLGVTKLPSSDRYRREQAQQDRLTCSSANVALLAVCCSCSNHSCRILLSGTCRFWCVNRCVQTNIFIDNSEDVSPTITSL
jgi:hypothetical protein